MNLIRKACFTAMSIKSFLLYFVPVDTHRIKSVQNAGNSTVLQIKEDKQQQIDKRILRYTQNSTYIKKKRGKKPKESSVQVRGDLQG
jgi:hypothetical protein